MTMRAKTLHRPLSHEAQQSPFFYRTVSYDISLLLVKPRSPYISATGDRIETGILTNAVAELLAHAAEVDRIGMP